MAKSNSSTDRRKARIRRAITANAGGRPRLSVFRSSKQIYAQVIDDQKGVTLAASRRSSSIAAATCIMAASRPLPRAPAKAASTSK